MPLGTRKVQLIVWFRRGQYKRYLAACEAGDFEYFDVFMDKYEEDEYYIFNRYFASAVIHYTKHRSSNGGDWYAHCNGYAKGVIVRKSGIMSITPYYNRGYIDADHLETLNLWKNRLK